LSTDAPPTTVVSAAARVKAGPWGRTALLLGPVLAVALGYTLLAAFGGFRLANQVLLIGALFLTFVGPTVIFGSSEFDMLSTWPVVGVVSVFSCLTAFFYAYNLDLLERVPKVGVLFRRASLSARKTLSARPWIRRWATFGVGFFVLLPLPGSGTLGGALMGRLVGLTPLASFGAVSVAGVVVAVCYGCFGRLIDDLPLGVKIAGALGFLIGLTLLGRWLFRQGRADSGKAPR
jgi:uncharacterized membrane protein